MPEIILTDDQARVLMGTNGSVPVKDLQGNVLGRFEPQLTPAEIAELKRRAASPGPWFTGEQVQSHLTQLQKEWDRTGGFDESYLREVLKQLDAVDPGQLRSAGEQG